MIFFRKKKVKIDVTIPRVQFAEWFKEINATMCLSIANTLYTFFVFTGFLCFVPFFIFFYLGITQIARKFFQRDEGQLKIFIFYSYSVH